MKRRELIKLGSCGLAAVAIGGVGLPGIFPRNKALAAGQTLSLTMKEAYAEMVDLEPVYVWAFEEPNVGLSFPGPAIFATEGDPLSIQVTNAMDEVHEFAVPGVVPSRTIAPGATETFDFTAPAPGTYFYLDPRNAPVNRVLGLHGALVVLPATGNTPYSSPTSRVLTLFDNLGTSPSFPGQAWDPARSWIWIFSTLDPSKNRLVENLTAGQEIAPADFLNGYLPRYFTVNGKSGFFSAHDPNMVPSGSVGQPALIRVLNSGLATHSPHIHGNHLYLLAENGQVRDNLFYLDTWTMRPLDTKDLLHPFIQPPDVPPNAWPPVEESFPMEYPMHCHTEISQSAGGGNYPQGLMVDWVLSGS